jgi:hypothetical protein
MTTKLTVKEITLFRRLVEEAWRAELTTELEKLFESFCHWADNGISAFDLSRFTSFTTAPPANSTTDVPHR